MPRPLLLPILLVLPACVDELRADCRGDEDCPAGVCVAGLCVAQPDVAPPADSDLDAPIVDARVEVDDAQPEQGAPPPDLGTDAPLCRPSGPELCNDADEDCDGIFDEGAGGLPLAEICYGGPADTRRVGRCRDGVRDCTRGDWTSCGGFVAPDAETCDGSDEDCDGLVDEESDLSCYDGDPTGLGVGRCRAGVRRCEGGALSECRGQVLPAEEVCGGPDEDCDGRFDEVVGGCGCEPETEQVCYGGPPGTAGVGVCVEGVQSCGPEGVFAACQGAVLPLNEACNAVDDDCDGRVDEDLPVDQPCVLGVGRCTAEGFIRCFGADGQACDAVLGEARPETCDGTDEDCDGRADEGFSVGAECRVGDFGCEAVGQLVCAGGQAVCSVVPRDPTPEVCNGLDDDCDGNVDEVEETCFTFDEGRADQGRCRAGNRDCSGECVGEIGPIAEICNDRDDDCDGDADEHVGTACMIGEGACEQMGVWNCQTGADRCIGEGFAAQDGCDGQDNDCDGQIDEAAACVPGPRQVARCTAGICEADCEPGWLDVSDEEAGCDRGCSTVATVQYPELTGELAAVARDGQWALLVSTGEGIYISRNGGAWLRLAEGAWQAPGLTYLEGHFWSTATRAGDIWAWRLGLEDEEADALNVVEGDDAGWPCIGTMRWPTENEKIAIAHVGLGLDFTGSMRLATFPRAYDGGINGRYGLLTLGVFAAGDYGCAIVDDGTPGAGIVAFGSDLNSIRYVRGRSGLSTSYPSVAFMGPAAGKITAIRRGTLVYIAWNDVRGGLWTTIADISAPTAAVVPAAPAFMGEDYAEAHLFDTETGPAVAYTRAGAVHMAFFDDAFDLQGSIEVAGMPSSGLVADRDGPRVRAAWNSGTVRTARFSCR